MGKLKHTYSWIITTKQLIQSPVLFWYISHIVGWQIRLWRSDGGWRLESHFWTSRTLLLNQEFLKIGEKSEIVRDVTSYSFFSALRYKTFKMALNLDKSSSMKIVVNCQRNHIMDSQPVISSLPIEAIMYTYVITLLAINLGIHWMHKKSSFKGIITSLSTPPSPSSLPSYASLLSSVSTVYSLLT